MSCKLHNREWRCAVIYHLTDKKIEAESIKQLTSKLFNPSIKLQGQEVNPGLPPQILYSFTTLQLPHKKNKKIAPHGALRNKHSALSRASLSN